MLFSIPNKNEHDIKHEEAGANHKKKTEETSKWIQVEIKAFTNSAKILKAVPINQCIIVLHRQMDALCWISES